MQLVNMADRWTNRIVWVLVAGAGMLLLFWYMFVSPLPKPTHIDWLVIGFLFVISLALSGTPRRLLLLTVMALIMVNLSAWYQSTLPRYYGTQQKVDQAVRERHGVIEKELTPNVGSTAALQVSVMPSAFETSNAEAVYNNWVATAQGRTIQKPASVLWPQNGLWKFRIEGGLVQVRTEGTVVSPYAINDGNYVPIDGSGVIWPNGLNGYERMKDDARYMEVLGRICGKHESEGQCQSRYNADRAKQREEKRPLNPEWLVVGRCATFNIGDNYLQLNYNGVPVDQFASTWGGNGGGVRVTFTNKPAEFVDCNTWDGGQTSNVNQ